MIAHANVAAKTHGWTEGKREDMPNRFLVREWCHGGGALKGVWVRGDQRVAIFDNARYYKTDGQKYCVWRGSVEEFEIAAINDWYQFDVGMACIGVGDDRSIEALFSA